MQGDPNIDWVRVHPLLGAACQQLEVGEMVHSSAFSLFDAMSAVEVGNPKMDAGARPKVQRVPLAERPLPLDFSKPQLLSWMDHLMCLEATWHVGGALAQTVYSSIHMMQLQRLSTNPTMSGFCRGLHAMCQEVNALVLQGCVCEEEDFMCFSTGLPIEDPSEAPEQVVGALSQAMDAQDARSAAAKAGSSDGGAGARLSAAIVARLALRKLLYQAVSRMRHRTKQDLDAAAKCLARAAGELAAVRASAGLGAVQPAGPSDGPDADAAAWAALGFDPLLNAHLAPPAPPRVVQPLSRDAAFDYFGALIDQLARACRITAVNDFTAMEAFVVGFSDLRPCAVARAALHLQLAQQATLEQAAATPGAPPAPAPLPPAQQPWAPSPPMIRAATACLAPGAPLGEDADLFAEQALIAVGNWVQAALLNPARHRRRLRRGLEDWAHLYQHAANADCSEAFGSSVLGAGWQWRGGTDYPGPLGPLTAWVERQTARVLADHLLMGFPLDLYEPRDYAAIFWYIDYLYGVVDVDSRLLANSRPTVAAAEAAEKRAAAAGTRGHKKTHGAAKGLKAAGLGGAKGLGSSGGGAAGTSSSGGSGPAAVPSAAAVRAALNGDHAQAAHASALRHLCQGLMHMMVALAGTGALAPPPLPFNSAAERFDQRFGSFHILARPEPLTYPQFEAAVDTRGAAAQTVLTAAGAALAKAANMFKALGAVAAGDPGGVEHVRECAALDKVAQMNRLACLVAERAAAAGTKLDLSFEFTQHRSFPVAVLKSKKV